MSSHSYIYLGPFIQFKETEIPCTDEIKTCTNTNCKNHKTATTLTSAFCPMCGSKVDDVTIKTTTSLYVDDLLLDIQEKIPDFDHNGFSDAGEYCDNTILANSKAHGMYYFDEEGGVKNFINLRFDESNIMKDKHWVHIINELKERNIEHTICYGLVNHIY